MARDIDQDVRTPLSRDPDNLSKSRDVPAAERPRRPDGRPALERVQHVFRVSESERRTLFEVGRFRTVAVEDLSRHAYGNQPSRLQRDLRSLAAQGLIQRRTAWVGGRQGRLDVLVLTRSGKRLLDRAPAEARHLDAAQAVYAGFVKPSEVAHDAAIYRMYHAAVGRLAKQGGVIRRVVLDYELKHDVYSPLAKARALPPADYAKRQATVARDNGLKVIKGKIPLPDLRIEYTTRSGEMAHVDLELATRHYHGSHLATKAAAGFTLYAADGSAARLTRVMEEREITAAILSM
jgi:DNA-binding MarR family transcriptional regulator